MNFTIKHKNKVYFILFILLIFFSFKDFYNNKRIIRYNVNLDFKNENLIYSKFQKDLHFKFKSHGLILDQTLMQRLDQRPAIETIEILAYIKNLLLGDKIKKLFLDYLKEQDIEQEKKQIIFNDIILNMKQNYFITLENGSLKNEIIFKTFYPEYAERFIEISKKEIDKQIYNRLQNTKITLLLLSLELMKKEIINDIFRNVDLIKEILFLRNGEDNLSDIEKQIFSELSYSHDKYKKNLIDIDEFFLSNEMHKVLEFIKVNQYIFKNFKNFYDTPNYIAKILHNHSLFFFYRDKIKYIQQLKDQMNYASIEKKSDDRFYDLFKIWSDFLMLLFIVFIFELILKIKIKNL